VRPFSATRPSSPEPGSTSRPSSVSTLVLGPSLNSAVAEVLSAVVVLDAMPMASEEPRESMRMSRPLWRRSPALVSALQITPELTITRRLLTSQRSGSASRARSIGLAKASPTIERLLTRSRCTVSSSSTGSKWRPSRVTMDPARASTFMALKAPVPCMSGATGTATGPGLVTRAWSASSDGASGSGFRAGASRLMRMSSWRHITPLGMPVVPPV
jgi:hypothetical protein